MTSREKAIAVILVMVLSIIYVVGFFTVIILAGTFISGMVVSAYYLEKEAEERNPQED